MPNPEMMAPFNEATQKLALTPQEQYLYWYHLNNLYSDGKIQNPDNSVSTVEQAVVMGPGGQYYNIPTVWGGQQVDIQTAQQNAGQAGWHNWPSYPTPEAADARYERIHPYFEQDVDTYRGNREQ
jgi:hypothetical protein